MHQPVGFFSVCVCDCACVCVYPGFNDGGPRVQNALHLPQSRNHKQVTRHHSRHRVTWNAKNTESPHRGKKTDGHQLHTLISETNNSLCHVVPQFVLNMLFRRVFAYRLIAVPNTSQKTFIFGSITRGLFEHTRGDLRHKYLAEQRWVSALRRCRPWQK